MKQDSVEEAFEQPSQPQRKIEINLTDAITSIFDAGPPKLDIQQQEDLHVVEGFGTFEPQPEETEGAGVEDEIHMEENNDFISRRELDSNRLTHEGIICEQLQM